MNDYEELEDALLLIKEICTVEQIQGLLRKRKGNEGIRVSAETKDLLIDRNLREALEAKAVNIGEVFDLIRDSEETGYQHVFYYKPKTQKAAGMLAFENVAQQLWGSTWKKTVNNFPSIRLKPDDYKCSDYRLIGKKPQDWILKVYGDNLVTKFTGKTERRDASSNVHWREYVEEKLRVVLVARWNSPDILELRVQQHESRRRVDGWHSKLWEMLGPALVSSDFEEWQLIKPLKRLVIEQPQNKPLYTCHDVNVIHGEVRVIFHTYTNDGDLFTNIQTRAALKNYLSNEGDCAGVVVTWLPGPNEIPKKETRTILAAKRGHEIVINNCSGEDLDYVTNQLRRFSK